jgi:hypothetical protein
MKRGVCIEGPQHSSWAFNDRTDEALIIPEGTTLGWSKLFRQYRKL